jgi:hypothetical protein
MQDFLFHNESTAKGINNLVSKEAERAHKAMQSLRAGEMTAGAAHTQVQISKRYQGIKKTSGALAQRGTIYAAEVQSGMQSYMANHMSSYLNYDSQGIADARNQWLKSEKSGSWLSKKWENVKSVANANELGRELEKRFRGHMIKTMTPLSDAQRAAPKSYHEEYEKGIKGRNLSPAEEAKARKLNIEAEIRSRKTMGLSEASKALAGGATSAEVRANVRTRFLESLATVIAGERGGTKKGYMGMAGQIYDQIAETAGLNSPLLSDYNKVFSLGTQILDKRKEATGWLGSYTPSVVAEHVSKEIKKYNKGLPTNITAMDPRARHMMESGTASMASATIATNEVKMVASTVKIGSTPLEQKLDQITNDITKTTEKAAGAVVISQYENNIIQTDNRSNSTSTGGASAPFFSGDHITELNKSGNLH